MAAHEAPRPWDSPGKNIGVGCHFLLRCMKVKSESEVAQSCPTLRDPIGVCSLPGSCIHGIFQARVREWGTFAFSEIHATNVNSIFFSLAFWLNLTSPAQVHLVSLFLCLCAPRKGEEAWEIYLPSSNLKSFKVVLKKVGGWGQRCNQATSKRAGRIPEWEETGQAPCQGLPWPPPSSFLQLRLCLCIMLF